MAFRESVRRLLGFSLAGLMVVTLTGAGRDDGQDELPKKGASSRDNLTIPARAASTETFRTLVRALVVTDLVKTLNGKGPFTVFAPTDEAFAKLGAKTLEGLFQPENREALADILKYHVVPGRVAADEFSANPRPKTVNGATLTVAANGHGVAVNDATVIKADVRCSNGLIHVVDRVLIPSKGGVLDLARRAGKFTTLTAAVKAAGLEEVLSGDGPFTVFAPTDEAFAKLGTKKLKSLLLPENKHLLAEILKYHVVAGRVSARDAVTAGKAKTLQGSKVEATIAEGRLVIGGARVLATDLDGGNGLVHVIDTVLVPPGQ